MVFTINSAVRCLTFKKLFDIKLGKEIEEWREFGLKLAKEKILQKI